MIIQHKAKRLDNGKNIQGFVMKMWGQYHIIDPEDENTAYPVLEESIDPVREFVPGRWFVNEKQIPMLQDVVLICKGWYSPCYKDEYEALRAYQAKLCMVEEKDLGYGDILQYSLLPACEAFLSRRRFCALFYDKMFCEDIFMHEFRQVRSGQAQKGKELNGEYIVKLLSSALFLLRKEEYMSENTVEHDYCVI